MKKIIEHFTKESYELTCITEEFDKYVQVTEKLACGKLKWFPSNIEERKAARKNEGFSFVEDNTIRIYELPGLLYEIILIFRKPK